MRRNSRYAVLLFAALIGITALVSDPSWAAEPPGLSRKQRRAQLRPVYRELQGDSRYLELRGDLAGRLHDQRVVDRYLLYLPMSPLEMLEIDMHERRYEMIVATSDRRMAPTLDRAPRREGARALRSRLRRYPTHGVAGTRRHRH